MHTHVFTHTRVHMHMHYFMYVLVALPHMLCKRRETPMKIVVEKNSYGFPVGLTIIFPPS